MSMTISASNYVSAAYQDKRTGRPERDIAKDPLPEAGKTRQSEVSSNLDQVNLGGEGIAVAEVSRRQGTERAGAQKQSAAPPAPLRLRSPGGPPAPRGPRPTAPPAAMAAADPAARFRTWSAARFRCLIVSISVKMTDPGKRFACT